MATHYHNTNKEAGQEHQQSVTKASKQEEIILAYFKLHPAEELTPFEVQEAVALTGVPITSIRRAMSNLTFKDKLIKTKNQKDGIYKNKKNFCWKLNKNPTESKRNKTKKAKAKEKRDSLISPTGTRGTGKTYNTGQPTLFD